MGWGPLATGQLCSLWNCSTLTLCVLPETPAALEGLSSPTGRLPRLKTETTFPRLSSQHLSAGGISEEGLDPDLPRAFQGRQQVLPGEMGDWTKHSLLLSSVLPFLSCPGSTTGILRNAWWRQPEKSSCFFQKHLHLGLFGSCAEQPICHPHYTKGAVPSVVCRLLSTKHASNSDTDMCNWNATIYSWSNNYSLGKLH